MNTYERNEFYSDFRDSFEMILLMTEFGQEVAKECESMIKNASIRYDKEKIKIRLGRMLKLFNLINGAPMPVEEEAMDKVKDYLRSEVEKIYLKNNKDITSLNWNKLKI